MLGILYSLPFILNSGCPHFLTRRRRHQVHALFKLRPQWFFFCLCACMYGEFRDWLRELKAGKKGTRMTIPEQKAHSAGSSGHLHLPEFTTTHDLLSMRLQRKQKPSPALEERQRQLRSECAAQESEPWCAAAAAAAPMIVLLQTFPLLLLLLLLLHDMKKTQPCESNFAKNVLIRKPNLHGCS